MTTQIAVTKRVAKRAPSGGTIGMNGEHYAGGEFLPSTTLSKGAPKSKYKQGSGKQEIENYKWAAAPTPTARSIHAMLAGTLAKYDSNGTMIPTNNQRYIAYRGGELVHGHYYKKLIALYNSGERWYEPKGAI